VAGRCPSPTFLPPGDSYRPTPPFANGRYRDRSAMAGSLHFRFCARQYYSAPAYRTSPSASALRALNAATQIGKSPNILGIVPPFAPRFALP
jgi:hypothetical protein